MTATHAASNYVSDCGQHENRRPGRCIIAPFFWACKAATNTQPPEPIFLTFSGVGQLPNPFLYLVGQCVFVIACRAVYF
ncbi:hypothetical protein VC82_2582 [Flagellimonas lutaonensis]|uniref:Uncharacterized protein n=1 Tax=Flagellimonas lutaonensis TaxID=516051 RepID=A0A0D5YW55_9FLAO|nr:hypothetical protein VC82_2582 [Allomuricauda lutaonensis]